MPKKAKAPPLSDLATQVMAAAASIDARGDRLGWLIQFGREDPSRWLPGEVEAHGFRLLAIALGATEWGVVPMETRMNRTTPLTAKETRAMHAAIGGRLRDLVRHGPLEIPTDGLVQLVVRWTPRGQKPARFGLWLTGPFETMFWQHVAAMIVSSDRLIACKFCEAPFLALRKALFCGSKCAQRFHDREKSAKRKAGGLR